MIEVLRIVQGETAWLAVARESTTGAWVALNYHTEPTVAAVLADAEVALAAPESLIEVVAEDGTVIP